MTNTQILTEEETALVSKLKVSEIIRDYPELVKKVIAKAVSQSDILVNLKLSATNNRARLLLKDFAISNNLKLPIYSPQNGKGSKSKLTLEQIKARLVKSNVHYGTALRSWILRFNLIPYYCSVEVCPVKSSTWNGIPITFDLDHINGDNTDNRIENLRFLCPNCHSQTETYKGKNARPRLDGKTEYCLECGEVSRTGKYCRNHRSKKENIRKTALQRKQAIDTLPSRALLLEESNYYTKQALADKYDLSKHTLSEILKDENYLSKAPYIQPTKTTYPETDILLKRVQSEGYEVLARELGVSGNAIRKRLQRLTGSYPKTQARLRKNT